MVKIVKSEKKRTPLPRFCLSCEKIYHNNYTKHANEHTEFHGWEYLTRDYRIIPADCKYTAALLTDTAPDLTKSFIS